MLRIYSDKILQSNELIKGILEIDGETIVAVHRNARRSDADIDYSGKFILPGFINMQSKTFIEDHIHRMKCLHSTEKSFAKADVLCAMTGVTTVYHSVHFDSVSEKYGDEAFFQMLVDIRDYKKKNHLVDHKLHLKYRLGHIEVSDSIKRIIKEQLADLITSRNLQKHQDEDTKDLYFLNYLQDRFEIDESTAYKVLKIYHYWRSEMTLEELSYRMKYSEKSNIPVAADSYQLVQKLEKSFKDEIRIILDVYTQEGIDYLIQNNKYGVVDLDDVRYCGLDRDLLEKIKAGAIKILTAKNKETDFLLEIFKLAGSLGLCNAVKLVTENPAQALNLADRGSLGPGKRADFIVVENKHPGEAVNLATYTKGKKVFGIDYHQGSEEWSLERLDLD